MLDAADLDLVDDVPNDGAALPNVPRGFRAASLGAILGGVLAVDRIAVAATNRAGKSSPMRDVSVVALTLNEKPTSSLVRGDLGDAAEFLGHTF